MTDLVLIPKPHIAMACKPGEGAGTCRYLVMGPEGFACAKQSSLRSTLDARVAADAMTARGDNCPGASELVVLS